MSQWRPQIKTLKEAVKVIEALSANQIMVEYQERDNAVKFPLSALSAIMGVRGGTIQRKWRDSPFEIAETLETVGAGGCDLEVGVDTDSGGIIEVQTILASFLVDATVADRTCRLYIPDVGIDQCTGVSPVKLVGSNNLTLSASQYGMQTIVSTSEYLHQIDNGTWSNGTIYWGTPIVLGEGSHIKGVFAANGQAADKSQLGIIYREVGKA